MKNLILLLIISSSPLAFAKADRSLYNIDVHVTRSHLEPQCAGSHGSVYCMDFLHLEVTMQGSRYEFKSVGPSVNGLLEPGDYKCRLIEDTQKAASHFRRRYELIFADDSTEKYDLTGQTE